MLDNTSQTTIGAATAERGFKQAGLIDFLRAYRDEVKLWAQYPLTE